MCATSRPAHRGQASRGPGAARRETIACRGIIACRRAANPGERGSLLVGALALLIMVLGFLLVTSRAVVTDGDAASKHRARTSAFYVAEAGLQYALAEVKLDTAWAGLAAPGKNCQEGSFVVTVTRNDVDGSPLPADIKRYVSTGTVNSAQAVVSLQVQF
ncbi:MAG: hypothetical protein HZB25_14230 [Candidatus Eisenbacteria bacterium]|nr:hypothetical protein [Candidatus Eisenbacteria bacterium]